MSLAYSTQCAAERGVSASVHSGNLVCGGKSQSVQWKHGVMPGSSTRECPLKPSVPPSTMGLMVEGSTLPSASYSAKPQATAFMYARASSESRPSTIIAKSR